MGSKYGKSQFVNLVISAVFVIAGLYLAQCYLLEFPNAKMHWEGIAPLLACLGYYLFS